MTLAGRRLHGRLGRCCTSATTSALQRGYANGDLSVVYPLARGTGPVLSVAAAILFLGERPSARSGSPAAR